MEATEPPTTNGNAKNNRPNNAPLRSPPPPSPATPPPSTDDHPVPPSVTLDDQENHVLPGTLEAVLAQSPSAVNHVSRRKSGSRTASAGANATPKTNGQAAGFGCGPGEKSGSRRERKQKFDLKKLLNLRGAAGLAKAGLGGATAGGTSAKSVGESQGVTEVAQPVAQTRRSSRVKSSEPSYSPAKSANTNGNDSSSTPVPIQSPAAPTHPRNSKEPLLKEVDPSVMLTGKRERKRKKFWDERDNSPGVTAAVPPAKVIKRTDARRNGPSVSATGALVNVTSISPSSAASPSVVSKSAKRDRRERKASGASVVNSTTPRHSPVVPDENSKTTQAKENTNPPENGQSLPYLALDLEQDPEAIAKELVEGVNIPGPGLAIPIDSSSLPIGWHKRVVQREIGVTRGKWDVFIQSPFGKSFRSKIELQKFFDERKMDMKSDIFDFSLDNALKRLRQIWKQYIIVPQAKSQSAEVKARRNSANSASSSSARVSVSESNSTDASNALGGKQGQSGLGKENDAKRESEGKGAPVPRLAVQSETGQGLRCSVDKCRKLFRNDRLLHQHIKHYHPRVYQQSLSKLKSKATELVCSNNENLDPPGSESKRSIESRKRKVSIGDSAGNSSGSPFERKLQTSFSLPETDDSSSSHNKSAKRSSSSSFSSKSKSQRKPSLVCANNANIMTTTEDDEVFFNTRVSRARTDSILSVGSEASALGDDNSAPIRPTFRVSKRRQAQLNKKSAALIKAKRDEEVGSDTKAGTGGTAVGNSLDEIVSSCHNTSGKSEVDGGSAVGGLGSGCPSVSYPPSEMDASVVSEHLTNEEVVNCPCKRTEEDGLMIQCDICLCWQHGICLGIDDEDQVPDKHVCQICRDPPGGRSSCKFAFDQDWLKEGKLGGIPLPTADGVVDTPAANLLPQSPTSDETAFKKLSELMADLANLSKVLHSLRVKLYVASQRNNSKVFMWSSAWHETEAPLEETTIHGLLPTPSGANEVSVGLDLGHLETSNTLLEPSNLCSQGVNTTYSQTISVSASSNGLPTSTAEDVAAAVAAVNPTHGKQTEPNSNPGPLVNGCAHSSASLDQGAEEINATTSPESKPCSEISISNGCSTLNDPKIGEVDEHVTANNLVATESVEEISKHLENGLDIDPNLIPSVSEVQRLLPSIIQATLEAQQLDGGDGVEDGQVHHESHHHSGSSVAGVPAFDCLGSVSSPHPHTPLPNPIYFPQQKRIDKDDSRINLLDHIEKMQNDLIEVLDKVEERLVLLEKSQQESGIEGQNHCNLKNADNQVNQLMHERNKLYSRAKCVMIMLQQDVSSARKLVKAL